MTGGCAVSAVSSSMRSAMLTQRVLAFLKGID
jgi:hypothetical protein